MFSLTVNFVLHIMYQFLIQQNFVLVSRHNLSQKFLQNIPQQLDLQLFLTQVVFSKVFPTLKFLSQEFLTQHQNVLKLEQVKEQ